MLGGLKLAQEIRKLLSSDIDLLWEAMICSQRFDLNTWIL